MKIALIYAVVSILYVVLSLRELRQIQEVYAFLMVRGLLGENPRADYRTHLLSPIAGMLAFFGGVISTYNVDKLGDTIVAFGCILALMVSAAVLLSVSILRSSVLRQKVNSVKRRELEASRRAQTLP